MVFVFNFYIPVLIFSLVFVRVIWHTISWLQDSEEKEWMMTKFIADISDLFSEGNGAILIILFLGVAYTCFMVSLVIFMVIKWGAAGFRFFRNRNKKLN